MSKKPSTGPHSPSTPAQKVGRVVTPHRPTPPYVIRGGRVCVCPCGKACQCKSKTLGEWPPPDYALRNDLDTIEQGRQQQRCLFDAQPDDSRAARLARILAGVPGVVTGDRLAKGTSSQQNTHHFPLGALARNTYSWIPRLAR